MRWCKKWCSKSASNFGGEGRSFFDIKRLNLSVTRAYDGTNVPEEVQYNTKGRPAWMNFVLPKFEGVFNTAVTDYNTLTPQVSTLL